MFCMKCGEQLPDGAAFCMKCGTPLGAVSPTVTTQAETINIDGAHTFIPAMCPNCNSHMKVVPSYKLARCPSCGTECLVQDAIKTLSVKGNVQVGSATINVSGTNIDSLLQRVEIMLADGDFISVMNKCEAILDSDPTNAKVYLYKLMANLRCSNRSELANQKEPFDRDYNYLKAMQFGDDNLRNELEGYINTIILRHNAQIRNLQINEEFYLGKFNGDCYRGQNGKRIWWKVINVQNHMALVMSCCGIAYDMPYHQPGGSVTWSDCTLRKWLNNDFINTCFSPEEKSTIIPVKISNENNPVFRTNGGPDTIDRVFLLSISEAKYYNKYLQESSAYHWLRSPGQDSSHAVYYYNNSINTKGFPVSFKYDCDDSTAVYPVMWIKHN